MFTFYFYFFMICSLDLVCQIQPKEVTIYQIEIGNERAKSIKSKKIYNQSGQLIKIINYSKSGRTNWETDYYYRDQFLWKEVKKLFWTGDSLVTKYKYNNGKLSTKLYFNESTGLYLTTKYEYSDDGCLIKENDISDESDNSNNKLFSYNRDCLLSKTEKYSYGDLDYVEYRKYSDQGLLHEVSTHYSDYQELTIYDPMNYTQDTYLLTKTGKSLLERKNLNKDGLILSHQLFENDSLYIEDKFFYDKYKNIMKVEKYEHRHLVKILEYQNIYD